MRIIAFDLVNRIVRFSSEPAIRVRGKAIVFLVIFTSSPRVFFFIITISPKPVRIFQHSTPFRLRPILAFLLARDFGVVHAPRSPPRTRAFHHVFFVKIARHRQRFHLVFENLFHQLRFRSGRGHSVPSRHRFQLFLHFQKHQLSPPKLHVRFVHETLVVRHQRFVQFFLLLSKHLFVIRLVRFSLLRALSSRQFRFEQFPLSLQFFPLRRRETHFRGGFIRRLYCLNPPFPRRKRRATKRTTSHRRRRCSRREKSWLCARGERHFIQSVVFNAAREVRTFFSKEGKALTVFGCPFIKTLFVLLSLGLSLRFFTRVAVLLSLSFSLSLVYSLVYPLSLIFIRSILSSSSNQAPGPTARPFFKN